MYTKEEREGILWEFRQSGPSVPCVSSSRFEPKAQIYLTKHIPARSVGMRRTMSPTEVARLRSR